MWVSTYVCLPEYFSIDQVHQFQSHEFSSLLESAGIQIRPSRVDSHNALGTGEPNHAYLQNVYHKILDDVPALHKADALKLATIAVNDTGGPSGLVPMLLSFGVLPRLPIHTKYLP